MKRTGLYFIIVVFLSLVSCATRPERLPQPESFEGARVESPDGRTHEMQGMSTWYGPRYHGKKTASGERFDRGAMTAAHKTLPFGTIVRVIDLDSGRKVVVRINDRGPFSPGRVIDLSEKAAEELGIIRKGVSPVQLSIISWK